MPGGVSPGYRLFELLYLGGIASMITTMYKARLREKREEEARIKARQEGEKKAKGREQGQGVAGEED